MPRLAPALACVLGPNVVYSAAFGGGVASGLRACVVVALYATNWAELAGVHISGTVTHLWSLAIEEQFYLVWPLLLYGTLRL